MFMLPWVQSVILCHLPICEIRVTTCTYFESKVFGFIYWDIDILGGYIGDATLFSNKGNVPFASTLCLLQFAESFCRYWLAVVFV